MSPLPVEHTLMSTRPMEKTIAAPERLDLESRTVFRRAAGEVLDLLAEGAGRLVIDLSGTRSVDSAGLGALMLIQRKAAERRQTVCLRGANEELRFVLVLTTLDAERGAPAAQLRSGQSPRRDFVHRTARSDACHLRSERRRQDHTAEGARRTDTTATGASGGRRRTPGDRMDWSPTAALRAAHRARESPLLGVIVRRIGPR